MIALRAQRHRLVLIALALCVWLSPALTLAADLHELVHELSGEHVVDASGGHHHDHHAGAGASAGAAESRDDGDSDSRDPVHLLVHCVHTCGAAFAGVPATSAMLVAWFATTVDLPVPAPVTDPPVAALLRPPRSR